MEPKIKRVKINIIMENDFPTHPCWAYTTPIAGLVVHPQHEVVRYDNRTRIRTKRKCWCITLYPIGLWVFNEIPTKEQAIEIIVTHLSKYQWVALMVEDIRSTNDMAEMSRDVVMIRAAIDALHK